MSKDYDVSVHVGWHLHAHSFLRPLRKKVKEVSHMEDRFDSKTGLKAGQTKVVDTEEGFYYFFEDEEFDRAPDPKSQYEDEPLGSEILEAIGEKVKANITLHGDFESGEGMTVVITSLKAKGSPDELSFKEVADLKRDLPRIHKALMKLGLLDKSDTPGVHAVLDAG